MSDGSHYVLAALEHQGIISLEMARVIDALCTDIVPLNFDAARQAVANAIPQLPPWDSCDECRVMFLHAKGAIFNHHAQGHPQ